MQLIRTVCGGIAECLYHLRPEQTRGAQLGDFDEIAGPGGEDEFDFARRLSTAVPLQAVSMPCGDRVCEFLDGMRARLVQQVAANGALRQARRPARSPTLAVPRSERELPGAGHSRASASLR